MDNSKREILKVSEVANTLLRLADEGNTYITNLKLQKLIYFCAGFYYSVCNKKLFEEKGAIVYIQANL